jgi:hypothetical protein
MFLNHSPAASLRSLSAQRPEAAVDHTGDSPRSIID